MAQGFKSGDDVTDLMNAAPVTAPHPEAKIGAPSPDAPVTLGDLRADPVAALKRVGAILGKDAKDPKLWMGIAASYFGPKLFNAAAPVVARAASGAVRGAVNGAASVGDAVSPDLIGVLSPRLGRAVEVAQRARAAMPPRPSQPSAPVAAPQPAPAPVAEPVAAPVVVAPQPPPATDMAGQPSAVSPEAIAERLAPFNGPRLVPSPQKLANDLGIAAKRAGVTVTAADDVAVLQAVRGGADPATAIADVVAAKAQTGPAAELARRFGLSSDAERTFPPNKSGLPTKAPKADAAAKIQAARARTKR